MKKLAITMGDPGGVGPEIIVKVLSCAEIRDYCTPIVVGDKAPIHGLLTVLRNSMISISLDGQMSQNYL